MALVPFTRRTRGAAGVVWGAFVANGSDVVWSVPGEFTSAEEAEAFAGGCVLTLKTLQRKRKNRAVVEWLDAFGLHPPEAPKNGNIDS